MKSRIASTAAVFVLYAVLVVWITWPLAGKITTHLPAPNPFIVCDTMFAGWSLAWTSHALVTAPSQLSDANIYHPARHTLFYGSTAFSALPYFAPVFLLTGNPTLALNVTLLGCLSLTALTLHVVVLRWTGSHLAGFVAASTLLATRWVWTWIPTAPCYGALLCFPLILFLAPGLTWRRHAALPLVLLIALQCLIDPVNLTLAVFTPLGILALWYLTHRGTQSCGVALLGVLGFAFIIMLPVYAGYLSVVATNPELRNQTLWGPFSWEGIVWEAFLEGIPARRMGDLAYVAMPLEGVLLRGPTYVPRAALLVILLGALSVALRIWRGGTVAARLAWTHGAFWTGIGILLSLPPLVIAFGKLVWTPHFLLFSLFSLRVDFLRLGTAGLFGLAVLAGVAFAECVRCLPAKGRWRIVAGLGRIGLAVLVAGTMCAEYLRGAKQEYPTQMAVSPDSAIISVLREPGGPLLELPVGQRGVSIRRHALAMYRSIFHWRSLLNGYSSYWPSGFVERMAIARRLPDPEALETLRRETGLEMILVDVRSLRKAQRRAWIARARQGSRGDLRLVAQDRGYLLFEVSDGAGGS